MNRGSTVLDLAMSSAAQSMLLFSTGFENLNFFSLQVFKVMAKDKKCDFTYCSMQDPTLTSGFLK
jgi:hypothetical protein